ncbi:MAG: hypothetical protein AXA67_13805 [Methylothermaceae bacteria B42]|nr:MAG: hypothetical protein AXA67_13805 [Methylothermaceae bacteria B42]HHJ38300.1 M48 family metallopeptidase [Methylothermaceae bacterium]
MTTLHGYYYDGKTSYAVPATLEIQREGFALLQANGEQQRFPLKKVRISSRLGRTPRNFYFPGGSKFETVENDIVDQALADFGMHGKQRWLHKMESKLGYVILFAILTLAITFGFVRYGMPVLANMAAFSLPASTSAALGKGALDLMDKALLEPSQLELDTRRRLQKHFQALVAEQSEDYPFQLLFRHGAKIGANAFALPSGTIVMTDELVKLADNDEQLLAVMAHEIGHVIHRHALRRVIQNSFLALMIILVTGDLSSSSSLIAALPTLLVEAQYSQAFEIEADQFATRYLCSHGLGTEPFENILKKLGQSHHSQIPDYLSSHPATEKRIAALENACSN